MTDNNTIKVSQEQVRKMKRAIGMDVRKVENGRYNAYRNFYATGDDGQWNELVAFGLARKKEDPAWADEYCYQLTKEGFSYLSKLLGVTITQED